jgi:rfaE bifunctional protein nucleotidyltransferase chain/domain
LKKVFTNGCFDVLHVGHIEMLEFCKSLGEVTVGLNSDSSIKRIKGNERPINNVTDRIKMLKACRYVDFVVTFEDNTPINLITKLKPDIIVKGGDYLPKDVIGFGISEIIIFNYLEGYSTTNIIKKIKSNSTGVL